MGKGHGAAPSAPRKYVVDMSATEVASELEALSFGDLAKAVAAKGLGGPALVEHHAAGTLAGELGVEAIPGELASRLLGAAPCGGGKTITILHFNDVYNLEPGKKEPVGGAAKFASLVAAEKAKCAEAGLAPPIVTFAGDALNPSMCSTFFKGRQMVPILNGLGVEVATVGNHDLDFGVENLQWVMKESSFPWLLANIRDAATGKILAGAAETHVVDHHGARVGFVGLAEEEWITTLATVNEDQVRYEDFVACGVRLAKELRAAGCDLVLALTHMRVPNDERLAAEAGEHFDAVLGGHDHHYVEGRVGPAAIPVLKAGTEFRWITKATFSIPDGAGAARPSCAYEKLDVVGALPDDPAILAVVDDYAANPPDDSQSCGKSAPRASVVD